MKKIRVGIIGTGFGAKVHAPMMRFHEGFEVVAIASVTRGAIEEVKKMSGVENVYTDWKQMLEKEQLDLVVVASAVHLHREMVLAAYIKGVHVLCEKPMALNLQEAEEMVSMKEETAQLGLINHEFRFLPARLKIKELLDEGKLGKIIHTRYSFSAARYNALVSQSRGWLGEEEKGGGMLGAIGSHMTDSLHWWTQSCFKEVSASLPIHVPTFTDDEGNIENRTADDAFQVIGSLANGATVTMEFLFAARHVTNGFKLEIYGSEGTIIMKDDQKVLFSKGDEELYEVELSPELIAPADMPAIAARYYDGFNRMLDALHETVTTGIKHPHLADFEYGVLTQKVLDAIRQSSKEGRRVTI